MEQLYRIETFYTDGWALVEENAKHLTKEQCDQMLEYYVSTGHNPNTLRAVRDN